MRKKEHSITIHYVGMKISGMDIFLHCVQVENLLCKEFLVLDTLSVINWVSSAMKRDTMMTHLYFEWGL